MKFILFVLMACVCLVGCGPHQQKPTQVAPVEKPQTVFYVQVDETLMPPSDTRIPFEIYTKKVLRDAAEEKGVPLMVWKVTNAAKEHECHSNFWNATCSVEGVDDIDTLKCIGNTLIEIPFIHMVGTRDFQIFKIRRCGNAGFVPAQPSPRR